MPETFSQAELAEQISSRVLELIDSGSASPLVLIDGRAGSGKSTLAELVQQKLFKDGESLPRVIHMDDLYDGWTGLEAGSDYLLRFILNPLARKQKANWQEYDWAQGKREQWREFEGGTPLIVEGCGALSKNSAEFADLRVWLEVDQAVRFDRWVKREGHKFDEQWPIWAAQELEFYAREKSAELADLIGH
jgi:uridine kinase